MTASPTVTVSFGNNFQRNDFADKLSADIDELRRFRVKRGTPGVFEIDGITGKEWMILGALLSALATAVLIACIMHKNKLCAKEATADAVYAVFKNEQ